MEIRVKNILSYYCEQEIKNFIDSSMFSALNKLVEDHELTLELNYGEGKDKKDKNLYLSLTVLHKNGKIVEILDEGFLTICTGLVLVDKHERCKFLPWRDDEFLDDLNWMIGELKKLLKNKT